MTVSHSVPSSAIIIFLVVSRRMAFSDIKRATLIEGIADRLVTGLDFGQVN